MNIKTKLGIACLLLFGFLFTHAQVPSSIVFEDSEGCLRYVADANDNRIVDFSYAGYKNGEEEIPTLNTVVTLSPIAGDNTAYLQNVIDSVSNLIPDADGFRGAILLEAGNYEIHGTLQIQASGVVLRGVGDRQDAASNTILIGVGNVPNQRNIIEAGGLGTANWTSRVPGSTSPITSEFVPAGSRTIEVGEPELYNVGDEIIIFQRSTDAWLASINYGGTAFDDPWTEGQIDIFYKRKIIELNLANGKVTLDVPIYDHLERALVTAEVYKLSESNIKTHIGIEKLRIVIETNGEFTEDHARNTIYLRGVEDCWVQDATGLHFSYAMVDLNVASRVTIKNCRGALPHSLIDGGKRYNFVTSRNSNNILFTGCLATEGRHSFVSNGTSSVSGIVWHNCNSIGDHSSTEGHRRWSQALLYDNITFTEPNTGRLLGLYNRGSFGTGHGWSATHSVAWNVKMPAFNDCVIQRPPRRQNYAIGCQGRVTGNHSFIHPTGYIEDSGASPEINSLYETQFAKRLANGAPVDAPARFSVEEVDGEINISWLDIADDESGYIIEVSSDGDTFSELVRLEENETSYQFPTSQLTAEMVYLRMYASSPTCPSAYTHSALLDFSVDVEEVELSSVKIFPNPTNDFLDIQTDLESIIDLQLFSIDGKRLPIIFSRNQLNVSTLNKGLYFLKMKLNSGAYVVKRFVKI